MIKPKEKPPGSGSFYLPLVENGKNVEEFEIVKQEQMSIFGKSEVTPL